MLAYLAVFGVSAGVAFVATPFVRRFSIRVGGVVQPSDRKVHLVPTPTMGGLAMYVGFLAGLGLSRLLPFFRDMNAKSSEPWAALLSSTLVVALGVDAAAGDPESPLEVTAAGYREAGRILGELGLPTVVVQEGGYDLATIGPLVVETLFGLATV